MSEYLSKEEIKKWRSSVEKITLEEYAARLGKKIQESKQTNDLADMLYTHYNPTKMPDNYDTVTKLEKIDLTPKSGKPKKASAKVLPELDDFGMDDDLLLNDVDELSDEPVLKEKVKEKKVSKKAVEKIAATKAKQEKPKGKQAPAKVEKPKKAPASKKEKAAKGEITNNFAELNITFKKALTDREEKVLAHFVEKRGEIVYAKDLAELLDLKRDYIYKYIKNLRAKMSTDIIANADNGGFKLN